MSKVSLFLIFASISVFCATLFKGETKSYRKIVSTLIYTNPKGIHHQVLKIKTEKGINIEIYESSLNFPKLVAKFEVIGQRDGYFILGGSGTNLAMFDIDHDTNYEILVPTFDHNLTAKLDIIKYDTDLERFVIFEETNLTGPY
jgi:hypothetical protein